MLSPEERDRYTWQLWLEGLGEAGQQKLKRASVLVSRCGGVGGTAALYLAAAGIGRLVLAHGGNLRLNDLHRQILMTHEGVNKPRLETAAATIARLNPHVVVETVPANISDSNVRELVQRVDCVVSAAPLFEERFAMNREAVRQGKVMVDAAMYDLEAHVLTIVPGRTACLSCLYETPPDYWRREFPVLGAVSGMAGCIAATEIIKHITGMGKTLAHGGRGEGRMLVANLRDMDFKTVSVKRRTNCAVCG